MQPDEAGEILAVVAEGLGCSIRSHRLIGEHISGDGLVSGHEVVLLAPDGTASTQVIYLESRPTSQPREGVLVLRDDATGDEVAVWLYPQDPALPALPTVVYSDAAAVLLDRLGLDGAGLRLDVVAYRPGRRAVVRAETNATVRFLKVVPPEKVQGLNALYALWRGHGIAVPETLGWTDNGMIAFAHARGTPVPDAIGTVAREADGFLGAVERLCVAAAAIPSSKPARQSLARRIRWYARRLSAEAPELAGQIDAARGGIDALLADHPAGPPVTVHGDLHIGQLFIDPTSPAHITSVLDIDTGGHGDPADDAAAFYAHLLVTALMHRDNRDDAQETAALELAEAWRERWPGHPLSGPQAHSFVARVRAIAATHLLAHALGTPTHRRELVERARRLVEPAQHGR